MYSWYCYCWCHMKLLPSQCVLCTPYNHAPCHFTQSHTCKVQVCLAEICHLHFRQNDQDLLHAIAVTVTWGWNGYWKRVSTESWPWRRKVSRRFCRDLNLQPFIHESGTLTTELSLLPRMCGGDVVDGLWCWNQDQDQEATHFNSNPLLPCPSPLKVSGWSAQHLVHQLRQKTESSVCTDTHMFKDPMAAIKCYHSNSSKILIRNSSMQHEELSIKLGSSTLWLVSFPAECDPLFPWQNPKGTIKLSNTSHSLLFYEE